MTDVMNLGIMAMLQKPVEKQRKKMKNKSKMLKKVQDNQAPRLKNSKSGKCYPYLRKVQCLMNAEMFGRVRPDITHF